MSSMEIIKEGDIYQNYRYIGKGNIFFRDSGNKIGIRTA